MILKKRSFKIDIFGAKVHMYMCKDNEAILTVGNRIIKKFKEDPVDYPVAGLTFTPDELLTDVYLFLCPQHLDVNTITHETQHILCYIIDYFNIDEQNDSNEVAANLSGFINQKVFEFIKYCGLSAVY